jgi:hypothetical protein
MHIFTFDMLICVDVETWDDGLWRGILFWGCAMQLEKISWFPVALLCRRPTTFRSALIILPLLMTLGVSVRAQEIPSSQAGSAVDPDGSTAGVEALTNDPEAANDYIHQKLMPYAGRWEQQSGGSDMWVPEVPEGWRPYTDGRWLFTDQGWAWAANEPWGWLPFHYGRWNYRADLGWAWVPGYVWGPAWVAWRSGGGYVGWAPLPPTVGFSAETGLALGDVAISPGFFTFVSERNLLSQRASTVILPTTRNVGIARSTQISGRYALMGGKVFNSGVSAARIAQAMGHPVQRFQISSLARPISGMANGPFYQPAVLTRAAATRRVEFGSSTLSHPIRGRMPAAPSPQTSNSRPRPRTDGAPTGAAHDRSALPQRAPTPARPLPQKSLPQGGMQQKAVPPRPSAPGSRKPPL